MEEANGKAKGLRVHRKGRVFIEQGKSLEWKAGEPFRVPAELRRRLQFLKHADPVEFRESAARVTVELVRYLVARDGGPVEFSKVQQEAAFQLKVSPETVKRYVFTHTAEGAELVMLGKRVGVNPFFEEEDE